MNQKCHDKLEAEFKSHKDKAKILSLSEQIWTECVREIKDDILSIQEERRRKEHPESVANMKSEELIKQYVKSKI